MLGLYASSIPIVDKFTNFVESMFGNGYRIAMAIIGLVALFFAGLVLFELIKQVKEGKWPKVVVEAVKLILIAVVAFFGLAGAFGLGRQVQDENLGNYEKPTINQFVN